MRIHRHNNQKTANTGTHTRRRKIRPTIGRNRTPKTLRRENNQLTRGETMNKEETQQKIQNQNTEPSPKQTATTETNVNNINSHTPTKLLSLEPGMTTGSRM